MGEYDGTYEIKGKKIPFYVRAFTPLQYTRLDVDDYISKRPEFTEDEWIDLLIQSIGFNPTKFDRRVKLLMLLRLVPFVEANYNLIELGSRETGKTYTFRNTSNRGFVISGGGANATVPSLFYNKNTHKLGVIGLKHLVFFDEISHIRFDDAEASINMLKDYMQTGKFSRGDQEVSAQCSIVLGGNIDTDMALCQPDAKYPELALRRQTDDEHRGSAQITRTVRLRFCVCGYYEYLRHRDWWYVTGRIPAMKPPDSIDQKLLAKYEIAITERQRAYLKQRGLANMQYKLVPASGQRWPPRIQAARA